MLISPAPVMRFFVFFRTLILLFVPFSVLVSQTSRLQDSIALQTVVIQATRAGENNPVPHTNITAEKIAKIYHAQDVPFLLAGIPSLVETSDAGSGVGYTGLRIRGSDPTRVNVTINGIPLNDAESQGVYWVDLPDLAASAAEIQVQRGVGSSTNGAGAFGATINLDLSKVVPDPFAIVSGTAGSFGTQKQSVYLGTGLLKGRLAFTGRISRIRSDGYVDRAAANLNALHLSGAYIDDRQSVMVHLLSGHEITYQAWYGLPAQYLEIPSLQTYNAAGTEKSGEPYADQVDNYTQRHLLLHYKKVLNDHVSLQLNGHYTRGFGFYEEYKAGQDAGKYGLDAWGRVGDTTLSETDLVRRRWLNNHFYGSTFAFKWAPDGVGHPVFLLGGGLNHYKGQHYGEIIWANQATEIAKDFRYYNNNAQKTDGNLFLKGELNLGRGWSAFSDLQYRMVRYTFLGYNNRLENVSQTANFHFFNPKAGFNRVIRQGINWYAFAGTAAREPNRDDFTQSSPMSRPKAEYLLDLETGIKVQRTRWNVALNAYRMQYRNQLVLDGRINDVGNYIRTNIPDSYRMGLEVEGAFQPAKRWTLAFNSAFSRNKIPVFDEFIDDWDTGEQKKVTHKNTDIAFSPNLIARGEVGFEVLKTTRQMLSVNLSGKYIGKQFLDNTSNDHTALEGFFYSNIRINYDLEKVIGERISFIFSINNILDARYVSNGWAYRYISEGYDARPDDPYTRLEGNGVYHQAGYFPQAGRQWMLTANVRF